MYKIARRYCANFEELNRGCNECEIEGWNLDDEEAAFKYALCKSKKTDQLVNKTVETIQSGKPEAARLKQDCKLQSLHPVPVICPINDLQSQNGFDVPFFSVHLGKFDQDHIVDGGTGGSPSLFSENYSQCYRQLSGTISYYQALSVV